MQARRRLMSLLRRCSTIIVKPSLAPLPEREFQRCTTGPVWLPRGLIADGPPQRQIFRTLARQLIKVLNGSKPADNPAGQPTTVASSVNLNTAKVLALIVPPSLLARADEVIE
jgi:hypothetical protein